jgi:hypothetical protein
MSADDAYLTSWGQGSVAARHSEFLFDRLTPSQCSEPIRAPETGSSDAPRTVQGEPTEISRFPRSRRKRLSSCRRACRGGPSPGVINKRRKSTRQRGSRHCSGTPAFRSAATMHVQRDVEDSGEFAGLSHRVPRPEKKSARFTKTRRPRLSLSLRAILPGPPPFASFRRCAVFQQEKQGCRSAHRRGSGGW